jgi:hypothetical protein
VGEVLAEVDIQHDTKDKACCSTYGSPNESCLPRIYIISTVGKAKLNESYA